MLAVVGQERRPIRAYDHERRRIYQGTKRVTYCCRVNLREKLRGASIKLAREEEEAGVTKRSIRVSLPCH